MRRLLLAITVLLPLASPASAVIYGTNFTCDYLAKGGNPQNLEYMGMSQFYLDDLVIVQPRSRCLIFGKSGSNEYTAQCSYIVGDTIKNYPPETVLITRSPHEATVTLGRGTDDVSAFDLSACE